MIAKLPVVRVLAFLVIGLLAAAMVVVQTMGSDVFRASKQITVLMRDTGGLVPASQVTYRGVKVGTVGSVEVRPDGNGVALRLDITSGTPIPASAEAVAAMDTPVAIEHLDLRPPDDKGPYLRDGSVIRERQTKIPLPLEKVLADTSKLLKSVDTKDLHTVTDELAAAFRGLGPQLQSLLLNSSALIDTTDRLTPRIIDLTTKSNRLLAPTSRLVSRLPQLAKTVRGLTAQVRGQEGNMSTVLDRGNDVSAQLIPLLRDNQQGTAALLANGAAVSQTLSMRVPALRSGLRDIPKGFNDLSTIFVPKPGGATGARLKIVTAAGPVCYYNSERRLPQDTSPRPVDPGWGCAGNQRYLQQRGAANAPVPSTAGVGTYDAQTGETRLPDDSNMRFGINGGQSEVLGARSWSSLLLQGVQ